MDRRHSSVRPRPRDATAYFTRDTGVRLAEYAADVVNANLDSPDPPAASPGLAAWNDFNPVAAAARKSLQNAARVEIPKRSFVMWVVVVYLLVLVPANWALFRGLRRVEWAWAAAPVIAVVCTGTVIRMAQLDIGFVRSRTELAVLEMQGDYARAHVTRYNALYTSLATSYDFRCDDPGAVVLPFPTVADPELFRMSLGQQYRNLIYRRGEQAVLAGFPVGSNSTGLVHSEEMLDAGGAISLAPSAEGTEQLVNQSALNLHGVGLLRRTLRGRVADGMARRGSESEIGRRFPVDYALQDRSREAAMAARAGGVAGERCQSGPRGAESPQSARSGTGCTEPRRGRDAIDRLVGGQPAGPGDRTGGAADAARYTGCRPPRLRFWRTPAARCKSEEWSAIMKMST